MSAGSIMALDVGVNLGVCFGAPNEKPETYSVRLKKPSEPRETAGANLIAFLQHHWVERRPVLIFKEAPFSLQAFVERANTDAVVRVTMALHGIIEAMAVRYSIPWSEKAVASIRKHFIGSSGRGERQATKRAVIARGVMLGYLPKDCKDDNAGDALAAWDFACAHLARRAPRELHMFGEEAA